MLPRPSDEELVRRIRAGDAEAAALLYERHTAALRARVQRRLPGAIRARVGASDVVQETYLAAFVRLGDFEDRGDGSFGRWVRGILEHKVIDAVRHHLGAELRSARRDVHEPLRRLAARQRTPSAEVAAEEEASLLRATCAQLADDHRTILRLVHDEGLTLVAAGERMGRSADAARMLYGRAVARLAERLGHRTSP